MMMMMMMMMAAVTLALTVLCRVPCGRVLAGFNGTDPNLAGQLGTTFTIEQLLESPLRRADAATVTVSCQGHDLGTVKSCFNSNGQITVKSPGTPAASVTAAIQATQ